MIRLIVAFVINLLADNDSDAIIKLDPPYNLLVDLAELPSGRAEATAFELNMAKPVE